MPASPQAYALLPGLQPQPRFIVYGSELPATGWCYLNTQYPECCEELDHWSEVLSVFPAVEGVEVYADLIGELLLG